MLTNDNYYILQMPAQNMNSTLIGVRVPASLYKDLQKMQSDGRYRSMPELVRNILCNHVERVTEARVALDKWRDKYRGMKYVPLTPEERDELAMSMLTSSERHRVKKTLAKQAAVVSVSRRSVKKLPAKRR